MIHVYLDGLLKNHTIRYNYYEIDLYTSICGKWILELRSMYGIVNCYLYVRQHKNEILHLNLSIVKYI